MEQIEGKSLAWRAAPSAVQLPGAIGLAHQQHRAGVVLSHSREHHVRAVAERREQTLEVVARTDREPIALGGGGEHLHEPVEVALLLGHHGRALRFVDVLPRLLAHRRQELLVALRQVHQQRATRLHEDRGGADASAFQTRADRWVVRSFRVAEEARAAFSRERLAHGGDRVGEALGRDERSARRVRDRESERQWLEENLRDAPVEDEPPHAPTKGGAQLAPPRRLQNVRLSGRDDQLVPTLDVARGRRRRPQATSPQVTRRLCRCFFRGRFFSGY